MRIAPVEEDGKVEIPSDWATELGITGRATLERREEGVLVRPCPRMTWQEIFATRLQMPSPPSALDLSDINGDDLLL